MQQDIGTKFDYVEVDISREFELARKYMVNAAPTFVILDRNGSLSEVLPGVPARSAIEESVVDLSR